MSGGIQTPRRGSAATWAANWMPRCPTWELGLKRIESAKPDRFSQTPQDIVVWDFSIMGLEPGQIRKSKKPARFGPKHPQNRPSKIDPTPHGMTQ